MSTVHVIMKDIPGKQVSHQAQLYQDKSHLYLYLYLNLYLYLYLYYLYLYLSISIYIYIYSMY